MLDRITETILKEYSKEHDIEHLPEDKRFEHLATYAVLSRHYSGPAFDSADFVVGAGNDTGIDAVAIIVNGTLVTDLEELTELCDMSGSLDVSFIFVQAERSPNFDSAKISTIGFGVLDFFNNSAGIPKNPRVAEAAEMATAIFDRSGKFGPGNPVCRMFYVTTGKWVGDANLSARIDSAVGSLELTGQFREVSLEPVDAQTLQQFYRQTRNAVPRDFWFRDKVSVPAAEGVVQAYIGYLPSDEFFKLIVDDTGNQVNRALFFDNVRDWLGANDVNEEIKETLQSPAKSRFALMNNGVTILARELRNTGDKYHIRDYSIVNGCQTSHVLFESRHALGQDVQVPVRVVHTQDEAIIKDIVRSTNRQTEVTQEQFFALEEFPKQLEQFFQAFADSSQRLYYERRYRQYDRLNIEKTRVISASNTIRAFAAMFLDEAHRATRNYAALTAKVGREIFGRGHKMDPYYTAALTLYKLEFLFRNVKIDPKYKPARFHILLAARIIAIGRDHPSMSSNAMERYCQPMVERLWSNPDDLIGKAVEVVDSVAGDNFDRDNIRTETFTKTVLEKLGGV